MKKIKWLMLLLLTGILAVPAFAQDNEDDFDDDFESFKSKKFDWDKAMIEPNIGFAYTNNVFLIGLAPYFGYELFDNFFAGPGFIYYFSRVSDVQAQDPTTGSIYYIEDANIKERTLGGGAFAQYNVYDKFFARARFEYLNRKLADQIDPSTLDPIYRKVNVPVLLLGAGYDMSFSSAISFPIVVSYDVVGNLYSPYRMGDFPLYIQIGFLSYF